MTFEQQIAQGANTMGLSLSDDAIAKLAAYHQLLIKWNKAFNLTAVRDSKEMVSRHILDSLSCLPYIKGPRLIDVGSGAGLPGIPIAICCPEVTVYSLDSNGKKTRFQNQVKAELGLDNFTVLHQRVEQCDIEPCDQVISRAFASIQDMLEWSHQLCAPNGTFLAMKGLYPDDELAALPEGISLQSSHALTVPNTEGARHLLILGRS